MSETAEHREYRFAADLEDKGVNAHTLVAHRVGSSRLVLTSRLCVSALVDCQLGVVALLYDASALPQWLWTSAPVRYGVRSASTAADLTGEIILTIDPAIVAAGRHLAIRHFPCPGDPWTDIKQWLRVAEHPDTGFPAVNDICRPVDFQ